MSLHPVRITGINSSTTESQLHDFFAFCGKINSIQYKGSEATINFEKPSAANTALMLNGGTLDGVALVVTSDVEHQDEPEKDDQDQAGEPISQSDKPRAGIAAEYLAKGYVLSDQILQQAIQLDTKHGISKKFLSYMQTMDSTVGTRALGPDKTISGKLQETVGAATQQARSIDEQKGISKTASDYYSRALTSAMGQKVLAFYTSTSKQVIDIHEEAKRISAHKSTPSEGAGESGAASASADTKTKT